MNWLAAIRSDIDAAQARDPAALGALEVFLTYPGLHALMIHRLTHQIHLFGLPHPAQAALAPQPLHHRHRDPPRRAHRAALLHPTTAWAS